SLTCLRNTASASGERQMLPRHTNSTAVLLPLILGPSPRFLERPSWPRIPRHPALAHAEPLEAHTEARSFFSRGAAESAESMPGRAAFPANPNVPRPDPRSR